METNKNYMSLRDLENTEITKGGVYVLNITPNAMRSQIVFSVQKGNGTQLDPVLVPATGYPIDLTAQVTKKQLLESSEFRKAINGKLIAIITESYYTSLMSDDGAEEEVARAMREMGSSVDRERDPQARLDAKIEKNSNAVTAQLNTSSSIEVEEVNPKVEILVGKLRDNDVTERETLLQFKAMGVFNKTTYKFISKNTKEFSMVQSWIKQVRAELFGN